MKPRWQTPDKVAFSLSLALLVAWGIATAYALIPDLWPNIIAGLIPPIPLWIRVLQTGLPKLPERKGGFEGHPVSLSIFALAAAVDLAALNFLSARVAELTDHAPTVLIVSLLVVPVFVLWVGVEVWALAFLDEFHRRIALETAAIAYALTLVIAFTIEMAQRAGYLADWTASDVLWPWLAGAWIPVLFIVWRRYMA
ncbi:MAG: hypothetical protein WD751_05195 [Anaerolineales bacterium]